MKKTLLLLVCLAWLSRSFAQTEVKISPVPLLFGLVAVSVEQGFSPSFGADLGLAYYDEAFGVTLAGKYYFNPEDGIDKFHIGAFAAVQDASPGIGFLVGYKWLSVKNVVFELGLGLGRSFEGGVVGYGKFHVGYRFVKR